MTTHANRASLHTLTLLALFVIVLVLLAKCIKPCDDLFVLVAKFSP